MTVIDISGDITHGPIVSNLAELFIHHTHNTYLPIILKPSTATYAILDQNRFYCTPDWPARRTHCTQTHKATHETSLLLTIDMKNDLHVGHHASSWERPTFHSQVRGRGRGARPPPSDQRPGAMLVVVATVGPEHLKVK